MEERKDLLQRRKEHKKKRIQEVRRLRKRIGLGIVGVLVLILGILALKALIRGNKQSYGMGGSPAASLVPASEGSSPEEETTAETDTDEVLHIVAVGDNMVHEKIYSSADTSQEVWNYDSLYDNIREDIQAADLAMVNEECVFVENHEDVSGYPAFGAPTEIGDALVNAGFSVVAMATNHVYDKGTEGILQSVDYWETSHPEVTLLGIHKDQETAKTVQTVEIKGITIALLNYTCLINGNKQDEIPTGMVDYANEVKMRADIQQARATADLVMVYLHTGEEYATEPSAEQISLLKMFLEEGVDITFCSHPHVLQGYETLQNDSGKQMLVYYSLGNFISAQKEPRCLLGGMADIKIAIDGETGGLSIQESQLIPLVTHYNYEDNIYTVYRLEDYTEELAASHSVHQESSEAFTLDSLQSMAERALTANYKIWE